VLEKGITEKDYDKLRKQHQRTSLWKLWYKRFTINYKKRKFWAKYLREN
jgi:hypothetical protein